MKMPDLWLRFWSKLAQDRSISVLETDELEASDVRSGRRIYVAYENGQSWEIAMKCPCGCNDVIELQTTPEAKPNWTLSIDKQGNVTLHPSVFRQTGCKAHFWLKSGRIKWCA
jgi:hypothetical protein|tara:strand:- start:117 stop:455 length:339 start_codon:yes stop_codon:yes gene_type:complete